MKRTSISLPQDLEAGIRELANQHERSEHGEMIHALREYVNQQKGEKMPEQERACVIGISFPDFQASKEAQEFLLTMFGFVHGEIRSKEFEVICANPTNISYDEAFIICKRKYFEVGWLYADTTSANKHVM